MLHRMVKKHIAGTTMSAALVKVEELNSRKIPASITFLTSAVDNKSRARYVTITYLELIRRISRLGLKASVHIPSLQVGMLLDEEAAARNLADIISTANKCGVFVWIEATEPSQDLLKSLDGARGYGFAFPEQKAKKFAALNKKLKSAKIIFGDDKTAKAGKGLAMKDVEQYLRGPSNLVLFSPPESIIKSMSNGGKRRGKAALEFKLGYSNSKLNKYIKTGAKVSVNVPFGKDWVDFAMNSVPEGYMRFLASNLLNEKHHAEEK